MGGVGGALLGSAVSGTVSSMLEQRLLLDAWVIGIGVGISMTVGLVFGIYPAIRASILDPVVALRYE
jgi:putative ABC transport system permease protein